MDKGFKQPKGNFIISYTDNSQVDLYKGINPITITFQPNVVMQLYEVLDYANEFSDYIVKEAKIILSEHNEFYKDWEIRFSNQFTGTAPAKYDANSDLFTTGRVTMNIYCKRRIK